MDPIGIRRPGFDEGLRDIISQLSSLTDRVNELAATIGSQGVTYSENTMRVSGNAIFEGTLEIAGGLIGAAALDSQLSAASMASTNSSWQPGTGWSDASSVTLDRPSWATSAIIIAGGYINPKFNASAGSPAVYGRMFSPVGTSPSFVSLMTSINVPAGLVWPFLIGSPPSSFTISTQAYAASGTTVAGGSASTTAVALWMR